VNVPVMVDDPGAATVALVPDNETTLVFDDEYDHDPAIDGETVGAVNQNDASPYVLDTLLHVKACRTPEIVPQRRASLSAIDPA